MVGLVAVNGGLEIGRERGTKRTRLKERREKMRNPEAFLRRESVNERIEKTGEGIEKRLKRDEPKGRIDIESLEAARNKARKHGDKKNEQIENHSDGCSRHERRSRLHQAP